MAGQPAFVQHQAAIKGQSFVSVAFSPAHDTYTVLHQPFGMFRACSCSFMLFRARPVQGFGTPETLELPIISPG